MLLLGKAENHGQMKTRKQAITYLMESIPLDQASLAHILNAEGEKPQKAFKLHSFFAHCIQNPKTVCNGLFHPNGRRHDMV